MNRIVLIISVIALTSSCQKADSQNPTTTPVAVSINLSELLVNVTPVDRRYCKAMHEQEKGILHGAGQDFNGFSDYASTLGKPQYPLIYMTYIGLINTKEQIDAWGLQLKSDLSRLPKDVVPQIGLSMTGGNDNGSGKTMQVARGDYDAQIAAFAKAVKDLGRKSFVRIGYEFEGSWNGYDAQGYIGSFIKITNELRKVGANAATVWCSGGGSAGFMSWDKLVNFYPGDEWVDWFGVDIFSPEEITDSRLIAFLNKADQYKKPVMIGETTPRYVGTLDGKASWDMWFKPFFGLLYANPQIKAICYINWDWISWSNKLGFGWQDWKDARIEKNETVKQGYIQELKKPIFVHSKE
ncbi:MAG: glycosyl hydrolase [Cyclobacteriaceae bacterium]